VANIAEDVELGEVALILGVVVVGGYLVYKALDKLGIMDLAKTTADTGNDTSFSSKVYDNTFSIDTPATKAGYGPTLSEAAGLAANNPIGSVKAIVSGWWDDLTN
jgi:hypothetical protein